MYSINERAHFLLHCSKNGQLNLTVHAVVPYVKDTQVSQLSKASSSAPKYFLQFYKLASFEPFLGLRKCLLLSSWEGIWCLISQAVSLPPPICYFLQNIPEVAKKPAPLRHPACRSLLKSYCPSLSLFM